MELLSLRHLFVLQVPQGLVMGQAQLPLLVSNLFYRCTTETNKCAPSLFSYVLTHSLACGSSDGHEFPARSLVLTRTKFLPFNRGTLTYPRDHGALITLGFIITNVTHSPVIMPFYLDRKNHAAQSHEI